MIEVVIKDYLSAALSVPVLMEKPTDASVVEYILVEKTGSGQTNFINTAVFVIQSYSDSLYGAASLNDAVKNAMLGNGYDSYGITAGTEISKCALNGDYNYTDTTTKSYRYQAVFDLVF